MATTNQDVQAHLDTEQIAARIAADDIQKLLNAVVDFAAHRDFYTATNRTAIMNSIKAAHKCPAGAVCPLDSWDGTNAPPPPPPTS